MRRIVPVLAASVLVLAAFLIYYEPGEGCNGGCHSTPFIGTGPCLLGHDLTEDNLLGKAVFDPETERPLCLIDIKLGPDEESDSYVLQGETDVYYIREGTIDFTLNNFDSVDQNPGEPNNDIGHVLVTLDDDENDDDDVSNLQQVGENTYLADPSNQQDPNTLLTFRLSAGASISLDNDQPGDVSLGYLNVTDGGGEAVLSIASAPPPGVEGATPEATPSS
jgi:hypothetical protein